ncbi:TetR family transcriptional regulator [Mesorhizobium sp. A623]
MARPRVIEQDDILDAAEAVVVRNGAAHLTLDAVAIEAGISKASVIYDYKSKQQLIKAVIERRVALGEERIRAATEELGAVSSASIRGLIAASSDAEPDDARAVAVNLGAALAQDKALRKPIQDYYERTIASVMATSKSPRGGLLAFLALEGLRALEWHDFHSWTDEERRRILQEIGWLVDAVPAPDKAGGAPDSS